MFGVLACSSVFFLFLFLLFLLGEGVPVLLRLPLPDVLFGLRWKPDGNPPAYGLFPMLAGTCLTTAGAMLVAAPTGVLTAVYLTEYCPDRWYPFFLGILEVLSGLPSVVYGFFGMLLLVPLIRRLTGESGMGMLTASLLLGFMILPTIVQLSVEALRTIPEGIAEGARALGADREQSVFKAKLPAAASGIRSAVIVGIGRAMGETMAVSMVAGNQTVLPHGLFSGLRTLTGGIALEMGYAVGEHREVLIAMGVLLLLLTAGVSLRHLSRRGRKE